MANSIETKTTTQMATACTANKIVEHESAMLFAELKNRFNWVSFHHNTRHKSMWPGLRTKVPKNRPTREKPKERNDICIEQRQ